MQRLHTPNLIFFGIFYLAICGLALSMSLKEYDADLDQMQADEYDYDSDDTSASSPPVKPSHDADEKPHKVVRQEDVIVTLGESTTLQCGMKGEVVLWYKDKRVLSTGKNLVSPEYGLDLNTFALTIRDATMDSQGEYTCELLPQKVHMITKVIVAEHDMNSIVPESSRSAQAGLSTSTLIILLVAGANRLLWL